MGLFDFIKKKLFGKTKKAEDSKKAPEKKLEKKNSFKIKYMPIFLGGLHNASGVTPAAFISIKSK